MSSGRAVALAGPIEAKGHVKVKRESIPPIGLVVF